MEKIACWEMNLSPALFRWRLIRINYQIADFIVHNSFRNEKKLKIDGVIKNFTRRRLKKNTLYINLHVIGHFPRGVHMNISYIDNNIGTTFHGGRARKYEKGT